MSGHLLILLVVSPFIGSFLGVVVRRLPTKQPLVLARSTCDACGHALGWRDLVPLVSWLIARGRCRHCHTRLSLFYPAIELAAVAVVLWAGVVSDGADLWLSAALGWTLLVLAVIDWRDFWLPDRLTVLRALDGLVMALWLRVGAFIDHAIGAVAGLLFLGLVAWGYRRLRGREGLGLGDAKLLAASGAWVACRACPRCSCSAPCWALCRC